MESRESQLLQVCPPSPRLGAPPINVPVSTELAAAVVHTAPPTAYRHRLLMASKTYVLYTLECQHGKYYVGRTTPANYEDRIRAHFAGHGSAWTKLHVPVSILRTTTTTNAFDENSVVLQLMETHGIANVRGGLYSNATLSAEQLDAIEESVAHATDLCLICRAPDHFARRCPHRTQNERPAAPEAMSSVAPPTAARFGRDRSPDADAPVDRCYACGRLGHRRPECRFRSSYCFVCSQRGHIASACPARDAEHAPQSPVAAFMAGARSARSAEGQPESEIVCYACGTPGHVRPQCRYRYAVCFSCGMTGHLASNCPSLDR